ncbi:hypothetical protein [Novipirellula artificiosorum]|uniref:Uncharacterized protein n=1 Tax=Novipirellula artificiosorum TaxID=2528016 RepID=A0A5C6D5H5_9BACT|nr:hypothetical protein [Novipirellula artificiosorum]TWU30971.1 hypothetical protein Poly41_64400 [Novipirellula artificiosorum]
MKYLTSLLALMLLTAVIGCGEKKAGVVADPDEYEQYETPPGAMEQAQKEAQAAAQGS